MQYKDYEKAKELMDKKAHLLELIKFFEQGISKENVFYNGEIAPSSCSITEDDWNVIRPALVKKMLEYDLAFEKI